MTKTSNSVALYEGAFNSSARPFSSSWQQIDTLGAFPTFGAVRGIANAIGKAGFARRRRRTGIGKSRATAGMLQRSLYSRSGLHGLGGNWFTDTVKTVTGTVVGAKETLEAKGEKLENALKLIIGLSGVAALTGIVSLVRR